MLKKTRASCLFLLLLFLIPSAARAATPIAPVAPVAQKTRAWQLGEVGNTGTDPVYNWRLTIAPAAGTTPLSLWLPGFTKGGDSVCSVWVVTDRESRLLAENLPADQPAEVAVTGLTEGEQVIGLVVLVDVAPPGFGVGDEAERLLAVVFAPGDVWTPPAHRVYSEADPQALSRETAAIERTISESKKRLRKGTKDKELPFAIERAQAALDNPLLTAEEAAEEGAALSAAFAVAEELGSFYYDPTTLMLLVLAAALALIVVLRKAEAWRARKRK